MADRPALSDRELRETLDLLGEVVASMSRKLDAQGDIQNRMVEISCNGLNATFNDLEAIRAQTDPAGYARHIGTQVENALDPVLDRLTALQDGFAADRRETERKLDALVQQEEDVLVRLRSELADARRRNRRRPFMVLLGVLMVLAVGIGLPRALAGDATGCAIIGADWSTTANGGEACVFPRR